MKDKSLILKKVTRRGGHKQRVIKSQDEPVTENWEEVRSLRGRRYEEVADILFMILDKIGFRIEQSTVTHKLRIVEYLTKEQENILLGDQNRNE